MRCVRNCSRCPARRSSTRTGSRRGSAAAPNGAAPARRPGRRGYVGAAMWARLRGQRLRGRRLRGRGYVRQRLRRQQRHRQRRRGALFVAPRTKSSANQCAGRESMRGAAVQVGAATRVTTARATTAWAGPGRQRTARRTFRCAAHAIVGESVRGTRIDARRGVQVGAATRVTTARVTTARATTARVKTGWARLGRQRRCGARFVVPRTKSSAKQCAGRESMRGAGDPIVCTARGRWSALLSAFCPAGRRPARVVVLCWGGGPVQGGRPRAGVPVPCPRCGLCPRGGAALGTAG